MNEQLLLDTINDLRTQIIELRVETKELHGRITKNDKEVREIISGILVKLAFLSGAVSFVTASIMGLTGVI